MVTGLWRSNGTTKHEPLIWRSYNQRYTPVWINQTSRVEGLLETTFPAYLIGHYHQAGCRCRYNTISGKVTN